MSDLTIVRTDSPCPVCKVEPGGRHDGQAHDDHTLAAALREDAIKAGPRG